MASDWMKKGKKNRILRRIDFCCIWLWLLSFAGCALRPDTNVCHVCPVVVIQAESKPQVLAIRFESLSRHVHVDGSLFVSDHNAIRQLRLFDYGGGVPFDESTCKMVNGLGRIFDCIEERCKEETIAAERDYRTVCMDVYRSNAIPTSYLVSLAFYEQLVADIYSAVRNDASADQCQGFKNGAGSCGFADTNCFGHDVGLVPDYAVLLAERDSVVSLACLYYWKGSDPVRFSRKVFFSFMKESVKLRNEVTIDEFRNEVAAKMTDYVNRYGADSSWRFKLVCWYDNSEECEGRPAL